MLDLFVVMKLQHEDAGKTSLLSSWNSSMTL
ncbi:hypothetical protein T08_12482 [Trichinella sp. T8]|nr:hypothetical protein T08_12482 [Trichinella sp. T8]